jgi:tRNA (cmo5U34)-methyltransferase
LDERWHPDEYGHVVATMPGYERLQEETVRATQGVAARRVLELGVGTGETSARLLAAHPRASLVGIDGSPDMLAAAAAHLPAERVELVVGRLEDALPGGPFDLAVSALAVHHLDDAGKRDLYRRVAAVLAPGGRFVLADVVRPRDPAEARVELEEGYDLPSGVDEQLSWLGEAGLRARLAWAEADLAVLIADARSAQD